MQLNITFRHMDSSDFLKEYAKEKVERVNKYLDRAGEAHVVLGLERHLHHADITIQAGRWVLRGREKSEDMYASIDLAMDKIERQLRRYKDKLKHHHGKERVHHREHHVNAALMRGTNNLLEVTEPEQHNHETAPQPMPRLMKSSEFTIPSLVVDEAVTQLDLMNNDFLVFTNSETGELNVVYRRRDDGRLGLLEAHAAK